MEPSKPKHTRLKFDLKKLKDSYVLETFQAMIGRKFAPLTIVSNEDTNMDSVITTFNTANTVRRKKPGLLQKFILDLCDKRRELKRKERTDLNPKDLRNTRK